MAEAGRRELCEGPDPCLLLNIKPPGLGPWLGPLPSEKEPISDPNGAAGCTTAPGISFGAMACSFCLRLRRMRMAAQAAAARMAAAAAPTMIPTSAPVLRVPLPLPLPLPLLLLGFVVAGAATVGVAVPVLAGPASLPCAGDGWRLEGRDGEDWDAGGNVALDAAGAGWGLGEGEAWGGELAVGGGEGRTGR